MTFATFTNVVLCALCIIVVIQSLRMVKGVREMQTFSMDEGVLQLDRATARAQAVVTELKTLLHAAEMAQNRAIVDGEALRDELSVMVGIGNAVAERIMDAAAVPDKDAAQQDAAQQDAAGAVAGQSAIVLNNEMMADSEPMTLTAAMAEKPVNGRPNHRYKGRRSARSAASRKASADSLDAAVKAVPTTNVGHA